MKLMCHALIFLSLMNFSPGSAEECDLGPPNLYPVCSPLYFNVTVSEALKKKSNVQQVDCTDPEGEKLQWKITQGNYKKTFTISSKGMVKTKKTLDCEGKINPYLLFIEASDGGQPSLTTTVVMTVFITSINDEPPVMLNLPPEVEVGEERLRGDIVMQCSLLDADSARLPEGLARVQILEGNDDELFRMDSRTCALSLNRRLDYETMSPRRLLLQAYELDVAAPLTTEQNITVTIADFNDHPPTCPVHIVFLTLVEATEPGTVLTSLNCSDIDVTDTLRYVIVDGSLDKLAVNADTGEVTLAKATDYETEDRNFDVIVHVHDVSANPLTTTVVINVDVTDSDDNIPQFSKDVIHIEVGEQWEVGREVLTLDVTDGDSPGTFMSSVTYSVVTSQYGWFYVHPSTGVVMVKALMDREIADNVLLTVTAHSSNHSTATSTVLLNITITDINDNWVRFNQTLFKEKISEASSPQTSVLNVTAYDEDLPGQSDVTFSTDSSVFSISPNTTGQIVLSTTLDYEASPSYVMVVTATESANDIEPRMGQAVVRIDVDGVNEAAPVWEVPATDNEVRFVSEDAAPASVLFTVSASDADQGEDGRVSYRLLHPVVSPFIVDDMQGTVILRRRLDREAVDTHVLVLEARDASPSNVMSATVTLTVSVVDYNDNGPECQHVPPVLVSDSAAIGDTLVTINCSDVDSANLEYVKVKGDTSGVFHADSRTGEVKLFRHPSLPQYEVLFQVRDGGSPEYIAYTSVTFIVEDSFAFANLSPVLEIPEDTEVGGVVFDADTVGSRLPSFFKVNDPEGVFVVQPSTGEVFLAAAVDREARDRYQFTLIAHTAAGQTATSIITVSVSDINDNSPAITGTFNMSVSEDLPVPFVLQTLAVSDADVGENRAVNLRIREGNDGGGWFSLTKDGALTLVRPLDAEDVQLHELVVVAEDGGKPSLTTEKRLVITVVDKDEFPPHFVTAGTALSVRLPENAAVGIPVVHIIADDADVSDDVKFDLISGNGDGSFAINRDTGQVFLTKLLNREERFQHKLGVKISNTKQKSATSDVTVTVDDVNDNAPAFSQSQYMFHVSHAKNAGTVLGEIIVTDADIGVNSEFSLQIAEGNDENMFIFDRTTLKTKKAMQTSPTTSYTLTIRAMDKGVPALHSDVTVFVTVTPKNKSPQFPNSEARITIDENSLTGTAVFDFEATVNGLTEGENGQIVYNMTSLSSAAYFHMSRYNGQLYLIRDLDYERESSHNVSVRAQHRYDATLFDEMTLLVNVVNVNDVRPEFLQETYIWTVNEGLHTGTSVGSVIARDLDEGLFGQVEYSLISKNRFSINKTTGEVKVTGTLDYGLEKLLYLLPTASDQAGPASFTSTATILIHVMDVNEHVPQFLTMDREITVLESRPIGSVVTVFLTQDSDHGHNAEVTCDIAGGNQEGKFHLAPDTCALTIANSLDAETRARYVLTVMATDRGRPPLTGTATFTLLVADENDNAPKFKDSSAKVHLSRYDPAGTEVYTAVAVDGDTLNDGLVIYSLHSGNTDSVFTIDPWTGRVRTVTTLLAASDTYTLTLVATDRGYPARTATMVVQVDIIPSLSPLPAKLIFTIPENSFPGTVVGALPSEPAHSNAAFSYSIISGNYGDAFRISSSHKGGVLEVAGETDREVFPEYHLEVERRGVGSGGLDTVVVMVVVVQLSDVNDNAPRISSPDLAFPVVENLPPGVVVADLNVTDPDDGPNAEVVLKFSDSTPLCDTYFALSHTGLVSVKQPLDYESLSSLQCAIIAADKGVLSMSSTAAFTATVVNIEEEVVETRGPSASLFLSLELPHDSAAGRLVYTLSGSDFGMVAASRGSLTFFSLKENGVFSVSEATGEVRVSLADLLYDQSRYFQWVVCHQAGGSGSDTQLGMIRVDTFNTDQHVVVISYEASAEYLESMRPAIKARLQLFFDNTSRVEILEVREGDVVTARRRLLQQMSVVLVYVVGDLTTDSVGGVDKAKIFISQTDVLKKLQLSSDGTPVGGLSHSALPVHQVMPYRNEADPYTQPFLHTQQGLAVLLVTIILVVIAVVFVFICCLWKLYRKRQMRKREAPIFLKNGSTQVVETADAHPTERKPTEHNDAICMITEPDDVTAMRNRRTSVEVKRELDTLLPLALKLSQRLNNTQTRPTTTTAPSTQLGPLNTHTLPCSSLTGNTSLSQQQCQDAINQLISEKKNKGRKKGQALKDTAVRPSLEQVHAPTVTINNHSSNNNNNTMDTMEEEKDDFINCSRSQTMTLSPSVTARSVNSTMRFPPGLKGPTAQQPSSPRFGELASDDGGDAVGVVDDEADNDDDDGISVEELDGGTTSEQKATKVSTSKFKLLANIFALFRAKQTARSSAQSNKRASMPAVMTGSEGQDIASLMKAKTTGAFNVVVPQLPKEKGQDIKLLQLQPELASKLLERPQKMAPVRRQSLFV